MLYLGRKSCIWNIKSKIYQVSKSIPAAKFCQNFVDILGGQKSTWANFLEFGFFLSEKKTLYRYHQNKNQLGVTSSLYINLTMKLMINSQPKNRAKVKFGVFWEIVSPFFIWYNFPYISSLNPIRTEIIKSKKIYIL